MAVDQIRHDAAADRTGRAVGEGGGGLSCPSAAARDRQGLSNDMRIEGINRTAASTLLSEIRQGWLYAAGG